MKRRHRPLSDALASQRARSQKLLHGLPDGSLVFGRMLRISGPVPAIRADGA